MQKKINYPQRARFSSSRAEKKGGEYLLVPVAVALGKGIHQFTEDAVISNETEGNNIVQSHLSTRRVVAKRRSAHNDKLATVDIEVLPGSPDIVDHTVVQEK